MKRIQNSSGKRGTLTDQKLSFLLQHRGAWDLAEKFRREFPDEVPHFRKPVR